MDTSISDSESSKIRTLLISMAIMRANTGSPNLQMSPMLPFLLMNSDLSTDDGIVMMALMIDQLGNNQTQDSFLLTRLKTIHFDVTGIVHNSDPRVTQDENVQR